MQIREQNRAAAAEAERRKERQRKAAEEKRRTAEARRIRVSVPACAVDSRFPDILCMQGVNLLWNSGILDICRPSLCPYLPSCPPPFCTRVISQHGRILLLQTAPAATCRVQPLIKVQAACAGVSAVACVNLLQALRR